MNVSGSFGTRTVKSILGDQEHSVSQGEQNMSVVRTGSKHSEKSSKIAKVIKEHVKGKLSLGAKILQVGGMEKAFKRVFELREGERLSKASECHLFTTAGPIAGILFISTQKISFCSNKPVVKSSSPSGELLRFHYKVVIPLRMIGRANSQTESANKAPEKYLQVVTRDDFEFWFMGFMNYGKIFKCLQQAISRS